MNLFPDTENYEKETPIMIYRYGLKMRPASPGAVPHDFVPNRTNHRAVPLNDEVFRHGYVDYDRKLTLQEMKGYELTYVGKREVGTEEPPHYPVSPEEYYDWNFSDRIRMAIRNGTEIETLSELVTEAMDNQHRNNDESPEDASFITEEQMREFFYNKMVDLL